MTLRKLLLLPLVALLVVACGVGPETTPRALPVGNDPDAFPAENGGRAGVIEALWFVSDDQLVPVNRTTEAAPTDEEKIDTLEAGPTESEAATGLRTALTPVLPDQPLVATAESQGVPVATEPGQVAVVLNAAFNRLPSQEQLLVLGQVVLSLADSPDGTVVFVDEQGTPVGVPLPSGRLTSEPLTATDFAPLIKT